MYVYHVTLDARPCYVTEEVAGLGTILCMCIFVIDTSAKI